MALHEDHRIFVTRLPQIFLYRALHADSEYAPVAPADDAVPDESFTATDPSGPPTSELEDFSTSEPLNAVSTPSAEEEIGSEEIDLFDLPIATVLGATGLDGQSLNGTEAEDVAAFAPTDDPVCVAETLESSRINQVNGRFLPPLSFLFLTYFQIYQFINFSFQILQVCYLRSEWRFGSDTACSGWIAGDRYIATAGHCLYNSRRGGYASSVSVYCYGFNRCRRTATTKSASLAVTSNWRNGNTRFTSPWDGGIIKTRDFLPYDPYFWGQHVPQSSLTAVVTAGYPGRERSDSLCRNFNGYNYCTQFTAIGSMSSNRNNGYFTPNYVSCLGHTGGPLYELFDQRVTGIQTGSGSGPCRNLAVALRDDDFADNGCNGFGGGVSIACLIRAADDRE